MARTYFSASSTGESTNGTTTYTDKVALTLTAAQQAATTDYYIFWSALLGNATSTTEDMKVRLFNDTAAAALQELNIEQQDTSDYISVGGCIKWTSAGTPADNTFSIEFACETNDTILIKEARIVILKKETGDEYAESTGLSTYSVDAAWQTKVALSFTPGSAGDYLFVPSAAINFSSTSNFVGARLFDGSTAHRTLNFSVKDTATFGPFFSIYKAAALSGAQAWNLEYQRPGLGTASIKQAALTALRLDTFSTAQYAESNAVSTTASASYQDKTTLTFTPTVTDHLLLSSSHLGNATISVSVFARVDKGGAALQVEMLKENAVADTTAPLRDQHFLTHLEELTASSTTWKTQWHQESGATNAAIEQSAIAVLGLEDSGITGTASITLASITSESVGVAGASGTSAIVLPSITMAATGDEQFIATAEIVLASITVAATGAAGASGTASITLSSLTSASAGEEQFIGVAEVILPAVVVEAIGAEQFIGTSEITLPSVLVSANGAAGAIGTATIVLSSIEMNADGSAGAVVSVTIQHFRRLGVGMLSN